jgi:hypothetical protein
VSRRLVIPLASMFPILAILYAFSLGPVQVEVHRPEAVPALELILRDSSEDDVVRADALEAIGAIDPERAKKHAAIHLGESTALGRAARKLLGRPDVVGAL